MEDGPNFLKPTQGINTLVSELSVLRLERTIEKLQEMRSKGYPEKDIRNFIGSQHKDIDQRSRTQIYRLSLGLAPKDDFRREDLLSCKELNETTLEIKVKKPSNDFQECGLVFLDGHRWVIVSRKEDMFVLKRI